MQIPEGYTEQTTLEAIEKAVNILAPTFAFGYFDVDDIKQEGYQFALELLETDTYDPEIRPFENYVYRHIRNRYINLQRNKLTRTDAPCIPCHDGRPCGEGGTCCAKYVAWRKRNQSKSNLMRPFDIENISDEKEPRTRVESTVTQDVEIDELKRLIDKELPVELRSYYLQMQANVPVPKNKRLLVERTVKEILKGAIDKCPSEDD